MNVIIANKYQTMLGSSDIDVIKTSYGVFDVNEIVGLYKNFFFNKMIIDLTALKGYTSVETVQQLSLNFDMSKVILLLDDSPEVNSPLYLSKLVSMGIYNFTTKIDTVKFLINNPNQYSNVARFQNIDAPQQNAFNDNTPMPSSKNVRLDKRIIGIKNVTEHAGATTLTYLMHKTLKEDYSVDTFEIGQHDFSYFNEDNMTSANGINIMDLVSQSNAEIILVDLNEERGDFCTEVIYLIEPGIIKLNKLIKRNPKVFNDLEGKKIIINMSTLNSADIKDFERESGSRVFTSLPYVDDKQNKDTHINKFLTALGFTRVGGGITSGFGLF